MSSATSAGAKTRAHTGRRFAYLLASLFAALPALCLVVSSTISIITERQQASLSLQYHLTPYSAHLTRPVFGLVAAVVLTVISFVAARRRIR
jgi:hypothetical protein